MLLSFTTPPPNKTTQSLSEGAILPKKDTPEIRVSFGNPLKKPRTDPCGFILVDLNLGRRVRAVSPQVNPHFLCARVFVSKPCFSRAGYGPAALGHTP